MNKKYWLRGGFLGLCLALVFSIYLYYKIPCTDIVNCKSLKDFVEPDAITFIYLPGIILGTIIGMIYGRIQTRK